MTLARQIYFNDRAPSNDTFDFHDADLTNSFEGTVWVSVCYWIATADALAAGAFSVDINYTDPTGQTRTMSGTPISLQDPTGFYSSFVFPVQRLSGGSTLEAVSTLVGSAAGALVSCRVMFSGYTEEDISLTEWT